MAHNSNFREKCSALGFEVRLFGRGRCGSRGLWPVGKGRHLQDFVTSMYRGESAAGSVSEVL